jgi:hypothetical protein
LHDFYSDSEDEGMDFDQFTDDEEDDWDSDEEMMNLPVLQLRRANAQVWIKFDVPQVFG